MSDRKIEFPRILAHRGTAEAYTENALMAFKYVIDNGITGFETDFRMTADGVVVVMHDADIKRTTTGEGVVERMTLAQLKSYKMKNSDEQVPTAEELMQLVGQLDDFYIELELKARYGLEYGLARMDAYLNQLYDLAQKYLRHGTVVFTCFDHGVLKRVKELHPDAKIGLIYGALTQDAVDDTIALGCYSCAPTLRGTSQELVDQLRAAGVKVNLWHSEDLELWHQAKAMGASVSTNNHPVAVRKAIIEAGEC